MVEKKKEVKRRCPFRWFGLGSCIADRCTLFTYINSKAGHGEVGGYDCAIIWIADLLRK